MSLILGDIQTAYYTAAQWSAWNGTLKAGQRGIESDTLKEKVGDGVTVWNSLSYLSAPNYDLQAVLTAGNSSGNLSAKFGTGTVYFGATNQTHVTYNAGLELHNTTANTLVNLTDAGLWKVDAVQYMPNLTGSRLLSLDANKYVVTSYTTTGSGTEIALSTSPTFVTDITTPLIIGGSAVGSNITYKSTSGTGTTTAAAHTFTGGTNGGTTIATLYNNGNFSIGNYASPNNLRLVTIGQHTAFMSLGSLVGTTSNAAFYLNQATPSATNYAISSDGNGLVFNAPAGNITLRSYNSLIATFATSGFTLSPVSASSGITQPFTFTVPANTGQTATEIPNFKVTGNTKTFANGGGATTIATQRWNYFTANTAATSGGGSLTITDSFALYAEAAVASGVTITNNWGFGTTGGIKVNATANTVLGNAALATNATTGFLHVPSCAGTPTGVPTLFTGMIPVCADSTNNKLYIYSGGAWVALN